MSNYLWLLDAGHGGLRADGTYTTAPKKMFHHPAQGDSPAFTIYEGEINRAIAKLVYEDLLKKKVEYVTVYHYMEDTSLAERVGYADSIYSKDKRCIFLSIHSNAGGGSGVEIFTSPGQTKSDKIANVFCEKYMKHFPDAKFRKDTADGDADKEADFYVLRKTDCPALLVENFFFDHRQDAEFLMSEAGQKAISACIVDAILTVEKLKPI